MEDIMIGKQFGRLTVVKKCSDYISPTGGRHKRYGCICECGKYKEVLKDHLTSGRQKSCGCLRSESRGLVHGEIHTRLYRIWGNMCNRCTNDNNPAWKRYGGRGINVCDEWKSYDLFREWAYMSGYRDDLTIDRIDNNKGYYPENCRWSDRFQQANNKRNNHIVEYNGETHTIVEWSRIIGIPYKALHNRIVGRKWDIDRAFTQPLRNSCNNAKRQDGEEPNLR